MVMVIMSGVSPPLGIKFGTEQDYLAGGHVLVVVGSRFPSVVMVIMCGVSTLMM